MAILHHKEEKIQIVLGRLPKKYTHEQFVEMFIKLYSKDWGKIKAAYIKQSQDKEPGTVINMPKPDLYLKQLLDTYNSAHLTKEEAVEEKPAQIEKAKAAPKKKIELIAAEEPIKKTKVVSKKKVEVEEIAEPIKEVKKKAPAKKKSEEEKTASTKVKKAKTTEK